MVLFVNKRSAVTYINKCGNYVGELDHLGGSALVHAGVLYSGTM